MVVACDQPIRLVLADPHPVMLDGLQKDLQEWPEFHIHACAKDGDSALRAIHEHHPDYIVLDLPLGKRSGLALIQELQLQQFKTRPIVFTGAPVGDVMRAIDLGVRGALEGGRCVLWRRRRHPVAAQRPLSVRTRTMHRANSVLPRTVTGHPHS